MFEKLKVDFICGPHELSTYAWFGHRQEIQRFIMGNYFLNFKLRYINSLIKSVKKNRFRPTKVIINFFKKSNFLKIKIKLKT